MPRSPGWTPLGTRGHCRASLSQTYKTQGGQGNTVTSAVAGQCLVGSFLEAKLQLLDQVGRDGTAPPLSWTDLPHFITEVSRFPKVC